MPLTSGTKLGPYVVVAPLGAGGMGEVYRAHDARLGRDVAIKVLPSHLAETPELRARFEREARTISQLNHPNICTLFDVGHQDGVDYLVMELIDGETLAHRLEKGALPLADALAIGRQVAQALDRAHRAGVVHRDLKPGNIMLTRAGAKLMDFGLARAQAAGPVGAMTQQATLGTPLTAEGAIVGTFQYMAPEQLEGKDADARADLWALGCVLYEMATGARAFVAHSQASLIAAIMERQPAPMASLQPVTPPALERIVRRCLAKSRDERFESAGDLAFALESVAEGGSGAPAAGTAAAARPARPLGWVVGAIALLAALLAGLFTGRRLASPPAGDPGAGAISRRFDLVLPDSLPMAFVGSAMLAVEQRSLTLSPRGDRLVYAAAFHGGTRLVSMDLVQGTAAAMPGTEGAFGPAFSPDGRWVAFLTTTALKKIEIGGSSPVALADVEEPYGLQWENDGQLLVAERQGRFLTRVRAGGGRLDSLVIGAGAGYSPVISPDGSILLWTYMRQVRVIDLKTGEQSSISIRGRAPVGSVPFSDLLHGQSPRLLNSGHMLYVANDGGGTLVGVPVSPVTLKPLGGPVEIASDLRVSPSGMLSQYDAQAGLVVYASDPGSGLTHFVRRHPDGSMDSLAFAPAVYGAFELSPDGTRIAALQWPPSGALELWILDLVRGTRERLGEATYLENWTADSRAVNYALVPPASRTPMVLRMHLDGSSRVDTLTRGDTLVRVISPDDRWSLRTMPSLYGGFISEGLGRSAPSQFMRNTGPLARFSPDSRWLAATYIEAGRSEIYVSPVDDPLRRVRVSSAGGEEPRWLPDGRHLVYRYGKEWFEASFEPGVPPAIGIPVRLFSGPFANVPGYEHSLFPDGSFLLLQDSGIDVTRRLHVITNVEALLRAGPSPAP